MGKKCKKLLLLIAVVMLFSSCDKVGLYGDLGEEDANEMLVLLSINGIKAHKKKEIRQNEVFWSILVSQSDIVRARELLVSHHLPRRKELGLTGVYKEKGLIPTPDEQKARFLLALKGEIINSLTKLPEVVDADVVLNIPVVDEFATEQTKERLRPTSSVVVKIKPTSASSITEAKIQQFVANAVEGLNPRDVAVMISFIDSSSMRKPLGDVQPVSSSGPETQIMPSMASTEEVFGLSMDAGSKKKLKVYILIFLVILLILALSLMIAIYSTSKMRKEIERMQRGRAGNKPEIEGQVVYDNTSQLGPGEEE